MSLAPDGAVIKTAGVEMTKFTGTAKVFDREEYAFDAVAKGEIDEGNVVVIRYPASPKPPKAPVLASLIPPPLALKNTSFKAPVFGVVQ